MCWSANGSIATWLFGMILAIFAKIYNTTSFPIWLLGVEFTQMQLIEYFLWKNLNNLSQNRLWSVIGFILIILQPVISIYSIQQIQLRNFLWLSFIIITIIYISTTHIEFKTEIGKNAHLKWNWLFSRYDWYAILWFIGLLVPLAISKHYFAFVFGLITLLFSFYNNYKYQTVGSYWCWFVVFGWLGAIIKYYIDN